MLPEQTPPAPRPLSSNVGSYQCSLVERVHNYSMTSLLWELEDCLHKEKRGYLFLKGRWVILRK